MAHLSIDVDQAAVAFGCTVELSNSLDSESPDKLFPHGGTEAVTDGNSDPMIRFRWVDRLSQQVTTDLTDILDYLGFYTRRGTITQEIRVDLFTEVSKENQSSSLEQDCGLTVQLCLTQSSQKRLAENFPRITTVKPKSKHCPTPMMVPVQINSTYNKERLKKKNSADTVQ